MVLSRLAFDRRLVRLKGNQSRFSADQIAGTSDGGVALTLNIYQF
jgi:hypothetical protein